MKKASTLKAYERAERRGGHHQLYIACHWDDVAYRRGGPHAPYCSERCAKAAEEADARSASFRLRAGTASAVTAFDVETQACPVPEPLTLAETFEVRHLHEGQDSSFGTPIDSPPPLDLLNEWEEAYFQRTTDERRYRLFKRKLASNA